MADSPDSFDRRLVLPHTGEGRHALVVRENLGTDKLSSTATQWRPVAGGWSGVAANPACGAGTGRRCNEANPDLPPAGQRPAIAVAPKAAVAVSLATLGMVYPADAASASVRPPGTSPPFSQRKTTHWSGPNCAGASPADPVSDNVNAQSPGPALRS